MWASEERRQQEANERAARRGQFAPPEPDFSHFPDFEPAVAPPRQTAAQDSFFDDEGNFAPPWTPEAALQVRDPSVEEVEDVEAALAGADAEEARRLRAITTLQARARGKHARGLFASRKQIHTEALAAAGAAAAADAAEAQPAAPRRRRRLAGRLVVPRLFRRRARGAAVTPVEEEEGKGEQDAVSTAANLTVPEQPAAEPPTRVEASSTSPNQEASAGAVSSQPAEDAPAAMKITLSKPLASSPIGVVTQTTAQGVEVQVVREGGLSDAAGLKVGDVVKKLNGIAVSKHRMFADIIKAAEGDVTVEILRGGGHPRKPPPALTRDTRQV